MVRIENMERPFGSVHIEECIMWPNIGSFFYQGRFNIDFEKYVSIGNYTPGFYFSFQCSATGIGKYEDNL